MPSVFHHPNTVLDRVLMAALTFLAAGVCVCGVRLHGEPFGWALAAGVLPLLCGSPYRTRGLASWLALPLAVLAASGAWPVVQGVLAGGVVGALVRSGCYFAAFVPPPAGRPNNLPSSVAQQLLLVGGSAAVWAGFGEGGWQPWLAVLACLGLWVWCYRPTFEVLCSPPLRVMYRVRLAGPGTRQMPPRGPVLVIANHACWFDPMFMGKVLIRPMKPMMTSRFYEIRVLRPLLKHIFRVIVVPDVERRRDAPELRDAVAALSAGECVLIFPEGYLRRADDKPLRRFGQGVWQILRDCPEVPVVACWIEGGWGSFCSFKDGPPTKNKPKDWGRAVGVGMAAPVVVPPDVLADHLRTRFHLMNLVSGARAHLGLEPLPPFELPSGVGGLGEE